MEFSYMPTQHLGPQSFFYYNPELTSENQRQGHYTPQPTSMPDYFHFQQQPFHRPQSAGPQMMYQPQPQYTSQPMLTPNASPVHIINRPAMLLQQENPFLVKLESHHYVPSTPTLSATGSSFSSRSLDSPTLCPPVEIDYFTAPRSGNKEEQPFSELCGDLTTLGSTHSPPLTPGKH